MSRGLALNDRYRLLERLATGGMGEVWRAADQALGREVAVKLLRRELMSDPSARERFRTEGMIAASLRHGGIAQVYDVGTVRESGPDAGAGADEGRAYLVMELVRGEPLADILARAGALPADAVLDLVAQAGRALAVAHAAGIVHRDVKPANLMVTAAGTVKITDFGIARRLAAASQTQTGMVMGTAYYLSPEQASGQGVTPSSDLYSLGVVAFECLAGRVPFDAPTPVEVALGHVREAPPPLPESVPAPVRELVGELLAKHPSSRPADADEVADRALVIRDAVGLADSGLARWAKVPADAPVGDDHAASAADGHTAPVTGGHAASAAGADDHEPTTTPHPARTSDAHAGGYADETETSRSGRRGTPHGARPVAGSGAPTKDAVGKAVAAAVSHPRNLPGFDENGTGDSLGQGLVAARGRAVLAYASVAAGTLLLGVIVVGTMWRGFGTVEPQRENQERLPAVQPGEGDPARRLPADPATRLHERRGQKSRPSPSRGPRTSKPRYPRASPTKKPTRKPPRATSSAPDPTPRPTESTTTPSTPSPDPSPTESGGLGSEDKV